VSAYTGNTRHRRTHHLHTGSARATGAHGAGTTPSRASHTCARRLECGSHAAAPAVLAIRCVSQRLPCRSPHSGITFQRGYRYRPVLPVTQRLECGSHAAAPAVLAITGGWQRLLCGPRGRRGCSAYLAFDHPRSHILTNTVHHRQKPWATSQSVGRGRGAGFSPAHQRPPPAPASGGDDAGTRAGRPRHGERLQPSLTQRDMWVMHSPQRGRAGVGACLHTLGARASGAPTTCLTGMSTVAYRHLAQQSALFGCHPRAATLPRVLLTSRSCLAVSVVGATHASPLPASSAASFRCNSREIGGGYGLYCQISYQDTPIHRNAPLPRRVRARGRG